MNKFRAFLFSAVISLSLLLAGAAPTLAIGQTQIDNGLCTGANLQVTTDPPASCKGGDATASINHIIHTVISLLSAVVGIVAVIMIIVGGFRYITSGGNDASVTGAKNTILYAIIGLIVVALAQVIVHFTISKVTNS